MQSVTSATFVAATARANSITLFASLELSKSKWVVTINRPGSEKFSKHVIEGGVKRHSELDPFRHSELDPPLVMTRALLSDCNARVIDVFAEKIRNHAFTVAV